MLLGNNLFTWAASAGLAMMLTALVGTTLDRNDLRAKLDKAEARVVELDLSVASLTASNDTLLATKVDGEEIARLTAQSCRSAVKFSLQANREAKEIDNADDDAGAARAYDHLLCQRPEAAGHPACAAASAAPG
jgi:multidrug resistance efflux pump